MYIWVIQPNQISHGNRNDLPVTFVAYGLGITASVVVNVPLLGLERCNCLTFLAAVVATRCIGRYNVAITVSRGAGRPSPTRPWTYCLLNNLHNYGVLKSLFHLAFSSNFTITPLSISYLSLMITRMQGMACFTHI